MVITSPGGGHVSDKGAWSADIQASWVGQPANLLEMDTMAMIALIACRKAGIDSPGEWADYAAVRG